MIYYSVRNAAIFDEVANYSNFSTDTGNWMEGFDFELNGVSPRSFDFEAVSPRIQIKQEPFVILAPKLEPIVPALELTTTLLMPPNMVDETAKPIAPRHKKRKMSNNPSAMLIAAATAETLESMNLDPNSKEGKKTKRQIRNRMSAQHHRDKKNQYIADLEQQVKERDFTLQQLLQENEFLRLNVSPACLALLEIKRIAATNEMSLKNEMKIEMKNFFETKLEIKNEMKIESSGQSIQSMQQNTDEESCDAISQSGTISALSCSSNSVPSSSNSIPSSSSSTSPSPPDSPITEHNYQSAFSGMGGTFGRALTVITMSCMMVMMILGMDNNMNMNMNMNSVSQSGVDIQRRRLSASDVISEPEMETVPSPSGTLFPLPSIASQQSQILSLYHGIFDEDEDDHHLHHHLHQEEEEEEEEEEKKEITSSQFELAGVFSQSGQMNTAAALSAQRLPIIETPIISHRTTSSTPMTPMKRSRRYLRGKEKEESSGNATMMTKQAQTGTVTGQATRQVLEPQNRASPLPSHFPILLGSPSLSTSTDVVQKYDVNKYALPNDGHLHAALTHSSWPQFIDSSVLSFSTVVMSQGRALLDPSLSFRDMDVLHTPRASPSKVGGMGGQVANAGLHPSIPLPLLASPTSSSTSSPTEDVSHIHPPSTKDFLPYGNVLSITLPAASIRMGHSWGDSKDGTRESIMSALNINASKTATYDGEKDGDRLFVENSSVELNCIILSAKLVQQVVHHAV